MNSELYAELVPILKQRLLNVQSKVRMLAEKLVEIDVPNYRAAGILDQLVLQLQQASDADDLYTSLEADYSDTKLVWE